VYHTNRALCELGHEVDEIWYNDLSHRINHGNLHYLLELPLEYRRAVQIRCTYKNYDVIQLSQPYAWLAAKEHRQSKRPGVFVNRSHGLELMADKIVTKWHRNIGIPENRFPRSIITPIIRYLLHLQTHKVAKYCDGIIVPSQDIADYLFDNVKISRKKVAVVHHGIKNLYVKQLIDPMTPDRQRKILYVGQFAFIKGPHILSQCITEILKRFPSAKVTWVCDSKHHNEVNSLISPLFTHRVKLLNWVNQDELLSIYDSHGIFLFPSFYEGAAKACVEAMSRGLCVVATNIGAITDNIKNGKNGFLIDAGNVHGFVEATGKLLEDINLCKKISISARSSSFDYTWERTAIETTNFYEKLLSI